MIDSCFKDDVTLILYSYKKHIIILLNGRKQLTHHLNNPAFNELNKK